jgi:transcriptional regulator with XRE-family HTH domain
MLEPVNKLGAFCRKRRKEMGLTLREAEERSGLSYSEISAIERGERSDIALSTVRRMANLFSIDCARFTAAVAVIVAAPSEDERSLEDVLAMFDIRERHGAPA